MEDFIKKYKNQLIIFGFVVMVYFLYFHNIWAYKLLDVDETRYVDMSRVMHNTKDFLTLYKQKPDTAKKIMSPNSPPLAIKSVG